MKKLLLVAAIGAVAYVVYRQVAANQAEEDLWNEATTRPDEVVAEAAPSGQVPAV